MYQLILTLNFLFIYFFFHKLSPLCLIHHSVNFQKRSQPRRERVETLAQLMLSNAKYQMSDQLLPNL